MKKPVQVTGFFHGGGAQQAPRVHQLKRMTFATEGTPAPSNTNSM
jgi:hypothetical protein